MNSDLEIAERTPLAPIASIAQKLGVSADLIEPYGAYKAKINIYAHKDRENASLAKLVLVSAINPTPFGEGKTTVSVGLADALSALDVRACLALREPSLGPVFGMKGGACGGGHAQVAPMQDINLHFTGDFHAIESANNLLAALLDNHIHQGNELHIDPRRVVWRRCMDMNDRQLRHIVSGLGGATSGVVREDGFDICAASEIMAVLCLARNMHDLKERLGAMLIAYTYDKKPVYARDLGAVGALATLLVDALKPNLVQTLEHTPVLMHGGPFANIAHGANSFVALDIARRHADMLVTEAGFGADLGCEKFLDIVAPKLQQRPSCIVLVATTRALKYHAGLDVSAAKDPHPEAVKEGLANLFAHAHNIRNYSAIPVVVAINEFAYDCAEELDIITKACAEEGFVSARTRAWAEGSQGSLELARAVMKACEAASEREGSSDGVGESASASAMPVAGASASTTPASSSPAHPAADTQIEPLYASAATIKDKMEMLARMWYHAARVEWSAKAQKQLKELEELQAHAASPLALCVAKTQYSISDDPSLKGDPRDYVFHVRELVPALGAGFVVVVAASIVRMPGLGAHPSAFSLDVDDNGHITGLS